MKVRAVLVLSFAVLLFHACGGKSNVTGEVVLMDKVCACEKWKTVVSKVTSRRFPQ